MGVGEQAHRQPLTSRPLGTRTQRRLPVARGLLAGSLGKHGLTAVVALACVGLAFNSGTFSPIVRGEVAVVVWWGLALAVGLSVLPLRRLPRAARWAGGLLAAYVLLMAVSVIWSDSAETVFDEFNRGALYLGLFAAAVLAGARDNLRQWTTGLTIGVTGVVLIALVARLYPDLAADPGHSVLFRGDPRATYPIGYWNGLGIFTALAVPLLLRGAVVASSRMGRVLAVAALPAVASVIYLTASRGSAIVAVVGAAVFVAVAPERLRACLAAAVAAAGAATAVVVLSARTALANGPLDTSTAAAQGRSATVLIALACAGTGLVWLLASRMRIPTFSPSRRLKWALASLAVAVAAAGVVATDPAAKLDSFKHKPRQFRVESPGSSAAGSSSGGSSVNSAFESGYTTSHFGSSEGSGRWQFWDGAVDEFRAHPILGGGAGSYAAWWAEHATIQYALRDAHSIYLETLAELGLVGLALLLGLLGVVAASAAVRLRRAGHEERASIAALTAVAASFGVGAGLDWMWELPAVTGVGIVAMGLLVGPATAAGSPRPRSAVRLRTGFVVLALALVVAQGIALLARTDIENSRAAASRGDDRVALDRAEGARRWQPWASSPYLQIALVQEQLINFDAARDAVRQAIDRDERNWRLWYVAARIDREAGHAAAARASLKRAEQLNPRSALFSKRRGS